jgi:hypothetical protein
MATDIASKEPTQIRAAIFWTCINIVKALRDFNGKE